MSSLRISTILLVSILILTSCFGSKNPTETSNPEGNTEKPITTSPQGVEKIAIEQQRVNALDKLTSDNLSTQVEIKDGKTILKNRRLFVNFFKSEGVNTSAKLIAALEKVETFAKRNGVELNESDILVMIAGSQVENSSWNVCGNFNTTKKDLDSKNKYYGYIGNLCNPPAPPKAK